MIQKQAIAKERIANEKISKGKMPVGGDSVGRDSEGKGYKGGKTLPKVEEDPDATGIMYSSQTTNDQNWGPVKRRSEHSYHHRINQTDWEYVDGTLRARTSSTKADAAPINGETRQLGFGEFADRTYVGILTYRPTYVEFLLGDEADVSPEKHKFIARIQYENGEISAGEKTGSAG